jgi:dihydropteroate synthase
LTSLPPKDRDLETAIISLHLADAEVDYLRVHNIVEQMRVFKTRACF